MSLEISSFCPIVFRNMSQNVQIGESNKASTLFPKTEQSHAKIEDFKTKILISNASSVEILYSIYNSYYLSESDLSFFVYKLTCFYKKSKNRNLFYRTHKSLILKSANFCQRKVENANGRSLASFASFFAIFRLKRMKFFNEISVEIQKRTSELNAKNMIKITNSFLKLEIFDQTLFMHLAKRAAKLIFILKTFEVSELCFAFATCKCFEEDFFNKVALNIVENVSLFQPRFLTKIAYSYGLLEIKCKPLFEKISLELRSELEKVSNDDILMLVKGFALANYKDELLVNKIINSFLYREKFEISKLIELAAAFAKLEIYEKNFFSELREFASNWARELSTIDLLKLISVLEKLPPSGDLAMQNMALECSRRIAEFELKDLLHLVTTFANLQIYCKDFLQNSLIVIQQKISFLTAKELSDLAKALEKLYYPDQTLFESICHQGCSRIGDFNCDEIASLIKALGSLRITHMNLFQSLTKVFDIRLFNSLAFTNLIYAFSEINFYDPSFIDRAKKYVIENIHLFTASELCKVIFSFANLRVHTPKIFKMMAIQLLNEAKELSAEELAKAAWSYAYVNQFERGLFEKIAKLAALKIKSLGTESLAYLIWSFVTFGFYEEEFFKSLKVITMPFFEFDAIELYLMKQAAHLLKVEAPQLYLDNESFFYDFLSYQYDIPKVQSEVFSAMAKKLEKSGLSFFEHVTWKGFILDFVIAQRKIALVLTNPSDYFQFSSVPTGKNNIRARLLKNEKWHWFEVSV